MKLNKWFYLIALSLILGGVAAMKLKNHVPIGYTIVVLLLMCGVSLIIVLICKLSASDIHLNDKSV